jgi:subtilisin-like proprotein convertase family protein
MITAGVVLLIGFGSLQAFEVRGAALPASSAGPAWTKTFNARVPVSALPAPDAAPPAGTACGVAAIQSFTNNVAVAIPDAGGGAGISQINVLGTTNPLLWDVDVRVRITHPITNQLQIILRDPNGTPHLLSDRDGGAATDTFNGTLFDNQGGNANAPHSPTPVTDFAYVSGVAAPLVAPRMSLGPLLGGNPVGTWQLEVTDTFLTNTGTIQGWDLTITTIAPGALNVSPLEPASVATPQPVPDSGTLTTSVNVNLPGNPKALTVVPGMYLRHPSPGQLILKLTSPSGSVVTLSSNNGGNNVDLFNGTLWYDQASKMVTENPPTFVSGIPEPQLSPESGLDAFRGESVNGTWTLTIQDGTAGGTGTLDGWELMIDAFDCCGNPAPNPGSNSPICEGSTLILTADTVAGGTYLWTGPNGFTSTAQNPIIVGATPAASGTYYVSITANGCTGAPQGVVVQVDARPSATITAPVSVCGDSQGNIATVPDAGAGATYAWTLGGGAIAQGPINTPTLVFQAPPSGIITLGVTVTRGACIVTSTKEVLVVPTTVTASSNTPACEGSTVTLTTPAITAPQGVTVTYTWTGPNGFISTLREPSFPNATIQLNGVYCVTVAAPGCTSAPGCTTLVVNPLPVAPLASSSSPVCQGSNLQLMASNIAGATQYRWTGPNGWSSSLQNPVIASAPAGQSGRYYVQAQVNGCWSDLSSTVVEIASPTFAAANPSPANNVTGVTTSNLSWTNTGLNEDEKIVYFDTVNPPEKRLINTDQNTATLPTWLSNTTYYWRVTSTTACNVTPSAVWTFTTGTCPWTATVPLLVQPAQGASILPRKVTLQWQPLPGASHYDVYLYTGASAPGHYAAVFAPVTSLDVNLNAGTTYSWFVRAYPGCGNLAAVSSETRVFSTAAGSQQLVSFTPAILNRYGGAAAFSLVGTGPFFQNTVPFADLGGVAGFVPWVTANVLVPPTVMGTVTPIPTAPAGRYDVGFNTTGTEDRDRLLQALVIRAFSDVTEGDYYFSSTSRVVDEGIMEGDADAVAAGPQFLPAQPVTRAFMAQYLAKAYQWWRTGLTAVPSAVCLVDPDTGNSTDFPDVACSHPQWLYIHWIKQWGVTTGSPCGLKGGLCYLPASTLNRAEMVTFLMRLKYGASLPGYLTSIGSFDPGCSVSWPGCVGWADASMQVSSWPRREANVAFTDRQTSGCSGSIGSNLTFCPLTTLTRGEVAEFLARITGLVPNP